MTPTELLAAVDALLATEVDGLAPAAKLAAVRGRLDALAAAAAARPVAGAAGVRIVPFAPRSRPIDEALHPGTGASERVGFVHSGEALPEENDELWILYELDGADAGATVCMRAWLLPHEGV